MMHARDAADCCNLLLDAGMDLVTMTIDRDRHCLLLTAICNWPACLGHHWDTAEAIRADLPAIRNHLQGGRKAHLN